MDARADPRPSRRAAADAVPASAGAVRLRCRAGGDEPRATRPTTIAAWSTPCARRGPIWRCRRISSSAFRARATPTSRRPCDWSRRSASRRPSRSSTAPARARPRPALRRHVPEAGQGRAAAGSCRQLLERQAAAFNAACVGAHPAGAARAARPPSGPAGRPHALSAGGPRRRRRPRDRRPGAGRDHELSIRTAWPAPLAPLASTERELPA